MATWLLQQWQKLRNSLVHTPQALRLVWQANRVATVGLGFLTIAGALLPATQAWVGKLIVDGVVAWNRGENPSFLGGSREGVGSAGVAFRVNLLGFAVGQFDFARPFQRPGRGWVFQFNLSPGY